MQECRFRIAPRSCPARLPVSEEERISGLCDQGRIEGACPAATAALGANSLWNILSPPSCCDIWRTQRRHAPGIELGGRRAIGQRFRGPECSAHQVGSWFASFALAALAASALAGSLSGLCAGDGPQRLPGHRRTTPGCEDRGGHPRHRTNAPRLAIHGGRLRSEYLVLRDPDQRQGRLPYTLRLNHAPSWRSPSTRNKRSPKCAPSASATDTTSLITSVRRPPAWSGAFCDRAAARQCRSWRSAAPIRQRPRPASRPGSSTGGPH